MNIICTSNEIRALKILFSEEFSEIEDLPREKLREQASRTLQERRQDEPENNLIWATVAHDLRQLLDTRVLH